MLSNEMKYCILNLVKVNFLFAEKYLNKDPKKAEEVSSLFQRQQVDLLLSELANKFPPKFQSVTQPEKPGKFCVVVVVVL